MKLNSILVKFNFHNFNSSHIMEYLKSVLHKQRLGKGNQFESCIPSITLVVEQRESEFTTMLNIKHFQEPHNKIRWRDRNIIFIQPHENGHWFVVRDDFFQVYEAVDIHDLIMNFLTEDELQQIELSIEKQMTLDEIRKLWKVEEVVKQIRLKV